MNKTNQPFEVTKSGWNEKIWESADAIGLIARELNFIAEAFHETGNEKMGDRLGNLSGNLALARNAIRDAVGEKINGDYHETTASTANMLSAFAKSLAR